MRINRYLAHKKLTTRRGADELIKKKKVLINGRIAILGDKVIESDAVEVLEKQPKPEHFLYLAYNKPRGIVTNLPQGDEREIADIMPKTKDKVFPIGRLDKESRGLIILTNDGRITDRMLNPQYDHEKEYHVTVNKHFSPSFLKILSNGVKLNDYTTKPAKTERLDDTKFSIILKEGRKRQIRRMCSAVNFEVVDLQRVRIMNITLGNIKENQVRAIEGAELKQFLGCLGL
jgi:23S rRNA pseudouridine2604 synthase